MKTFNPLGMRHLRLEHPWEEPPPRIRRRRHGVLVAEPPALQGHEAERSEPHHRPGTGERTFAQNC